MTDKEIARGEDFPIEATVNHVKEVILLPTDLILTSDPVFKWLKNANIDTKKIKGIGYADNFIERLEKELIIFFTKRRICINYNQYDAIKEQLISFITMP